MSSSKWSSYNKIKIEVDKIFSADHDCQIEAGAAESIDTNQKKQRKYRSRVKQLTVQDLLQKFDMPQTPFSLNLAEPLQISEFQNYKHAQLHTGAMYWCIHSESTDVVLLNDYDLENGVMMPLSYMYTTLMHNRDGSTTMSCSCSSFSMLMEFVDGDDLDSSVVTCMHCRFMNMCIGDPVDYMRVFSSTCPEEHHLAIFHKILNSPTFCANIQALGHDHQYPISGTKKFSVRAGDEDDPLCEFVHLTLDGTFITCQSGFCNLQMGLCSRRKTSRLLISEEIQNLCPHLNVMLQNLESWSHFIGNNHTDAAYTLHTTTSVPVSFLFNSKFICF